MRSVLPLLLLLSLGGCAGRADVWPDNSWRIEQAMAPEDPAAPLPEGIALGPDAAPLAAPDHSAVRVRDEPAATEAEAYGRTWGYRHGLYGVPPQKPSQEERRAEPLIRKRHLGSTPGLLP